MDRQAEGRGQHQGNIEGQRWRHRNGRSTEQRGQDSSHSPFVLLSFQALPPHRRARWADLYRPLIFYGKTKISAADSEAEELRAAGSRAPTGETRSLGDLPREEVARSEFPGTAAHAAAKGPRSSLPCDFVPVAAGRVSGNISRSALTGSRGEGNRASLAHLAFPPTPGGV